MQKVLVEKLRKKAEEVATAFSDPNRFKNQTQETFTVEKIQPLSDYTAAVYFRKNTMKIGLSFFYYVETKDGYWQYFFPKDSHILGMMMFSKIKMEIEDENWDKN